jgi:hypothetical protein
MKPNRGEILESFSLKICHQAEPRNITKRSVSLHFSEHTHRLSVRILEFPGSNTDTETYYPELYRPFSQSIHANARMICPFRPNSSVTSHLFLFIIALPIPPSFNFSFFLPPVPLLTSKSSSFFLFHHLLFLPCSAFFLLNVFTSNIVRSELG